MSSQGHRLVRSLCLGEPIHESHMFVAADALLQYLYQFARAGREYGFDMNPQARELAEPDDSVGIRCKFSAGAATHWSSLTCDCLPNSGRMQIEIDRAVVHFHGCIVTGLHARSVCLVVK